MGFKGKIRRQTIIANKEIAAIFALHLSGKYISALGFGKIHYIVRIQFGDSYIFRNVQVLMLFKSDLGRVVIFCVKTANAVNGKFKTIDQKINNENGCNNTNNN
jgi:hypothetical protein